MGATRNLKSQILDLRSKGKSYREISFLLSCSKSTVCYHLTPLEKEKTLTRSRKRRKRGDVVLSRRISRFKQAGVEDVRRGWRSCKKRMPPRELLRSRVKLYKKRDKGGYLSKTPKSDFNIADVDKKIGKNPKCYLSGRKINIEDSSSYHLDHIVPVSKGGANSLENLGFTNPLANKAKSDMTVNEFVRLCIDVVKWNGYRLTKRKINDRKKV